VNYSVAIKYKSLYTRSLFPYYGKVSQESFFLTKKGKVLINFISVLCMLHRKWGNVWSNLSRIHRNWSQLEKAMGWI